MYYQTTITIPANTAESEPVRESVRMAKGTISKVEIIFPPGCCGLVHIQILHHESIIFPSSPDESYIGNEYPIFWNEDFPLTESPFELVVQGWNYDVRYSHSPVVRFEMLSQVNNLASYFAKLIGVVQT